LRSSPRRDAEWRCAVRSDKVTLWMVMQHAPVII